MTNNIHKTMVKIYDTAAFDRKERRWRMKEKHINKLINKIQKYIIKNFCNHTLNDEILDDLTYSITIGQLEQIKEELELVLK